MNIAARRIALSETIQNFSDRRDYDILFCMANYKFPKCTSRMLRSIGKLDAKCLAIVTGCRKRDLEAIAKHEYPCDVVLMKAPRNCMYLCRAWGFIWAVHEGIRADFMFSADDDLEFIDESAHILPALNEVKEDPGFSVAGFSGSGMKIAGKQAGICQLNPTFMDGHLLVTQWDDNLNYGLPDSLPREAMSYFTELEYQHRMRILTGRPTVRIGGDVSYIHHFRRDPARTKARNASCSRGMYAGCQLWKVKYGIEDLLIASDMHECDRIFELVKDKKEEMKQHILFGGLWNSWLVIYYKFEDQFKRIM